MRSLLLVSATAFEIAPAVKFLAGHATKQLRITTCITGVGMVNTAFELGRLHGQPFDMAVNAGIAGSFGDLKNGDVLRVNSDCFAELGAEDDTAFLSIDDLGFGTQKVVIQRELKNEALLQLPQATGITVNTTHGNVVSIENMRSRYTPDVETMEGAAFIHAANSFGWQAAQIRAISNKVEKRNRENWNIPLAIENLNTVIIDLINYLDEH